MTTRIMVNMLPGLSLAIFAALAGLAVAQAQGYPLKAIRLVVPLAPGGGNDTLARYVGKYLTEGLGQPVVIENRAGGGRLAGGEYAETVKIVQRRDVRDILTLQGMAAMSGTPEDFAARIKSEMEKTAQVVRESGMRLN